MGPAEAPQNQPHDQPYNQPPGQPHNQPPGQPQNAHQDQQQQPPQQPQQQQPPQPQQPQQPQQQPPQPQQPQQPPPQQLGSQSQKGAHSGRQPLVPYAVGAVPTAELPTLDATPAGAKPICRKFDGGLRLYGIWYVKKLDHNLASPQERLICVARNAAMVCNPKSTGVHRLFRIAQLQHLLVKELRDTLQIAFLFTKEAKEPGLVMQVARRAADARSVCCRAEHQHDPLEMVRVLQWAYRQVTGRELGVYVWGTAKVQSLGPLDKGRVAGYLTPKQKMNAWAQQYERVSAALGSPHSQKSGSPGEQGAPPAQPVQPASMPQHPAPQQGDAAGQQLPQPAAPGGPAAGVPGEGQEPQPAAAAPEQPLPPEQQQQQQQPGYQQQPEHLTQPEQQQPQQYQQPQQQYRQEQPEQQPVAAQEDAPLTALAGELRELQQELLRQQTSLLQREQQLQQQQVDISRRETELRRTQREGEPPMRSGPCMPPAPTDWAEELANFEKRDGHPDNPWTELSAALPHSAAVLAVMCTGPSGPATQDGPAAILRQVLRVRQDQRDLYDALAAAAKIAKPSPAPEQAAPAAVSAQWAAFLRIREERRAGGGAEEPRRAAPTPTEQLCTPAPPPARPERAAASPVARSERAAASPAARPEERGAGQRPAEAAQQTATQQRSAVPPSPSPMPAPATPQHRSRSGTPATGVGCAPLTMPGDAVVVGMSGATVRADIDQASEKVGWLGPGRTLVVSEVHGRRARVVGPIDGWTSTVADNGMPILGEASAPVRLRFDCPDYPDMAGVYVLQPGLVRGSRWWLREGGGGWLSRSASTGLWLFAQTEDHFQDDLGWVQSADPALPHNDTEWQPYKQDKEVWEFDPAVRTMLLPGGMPQPQRRSPAKRPEPAPGPPPACRTVRAPSPPPAARPAGLGPAAPKHVASPVSPAALRWPTPPRGGREVPYRASPLLRASTPPLRASTPPLRQTLCSPPTPSPARDPAAALFLGTPPRKRQPCGLTHSGLGGGGLPQPSPAAGAW